MVSTAYNLRKMSKGGIQPPQSHLLSHTFSTTSVNLVPQLEIFLVSLCHPRGQLWAKGLQTLRPFSGRNWQF